MTLYDLFLLMAAASTICGLYLGYWLAWCWGWHWAWPDGPQWLVRPHAVSFLLLNITGLIITLVIVSRADT